MRRTVMGLVVLALLCACATTPQGKVAQTALVAESVHNGAQEPVLDGLEQAGDGFASAGQHAGVEMVEGANLDAEGPASAG